MRCRGSGGGHPSVSEVAGLANYVTWRDATDPAGGPQAGVHLTIRCREDLRLFSALASLGKAGELGERVETQPDAEGLFIVE